MCEVRGIKPLGEPLGEIWAVAERPYFYNHKDEKPALGVDLKWAHLAHMIT